MRTLFFFFLVLSLLVGMSSADSINLKEEDGNYYLSLTCTQPCKIGAYYIQLNYTPGTTVVESVEGMDTFGTVVDIDNVLGVAKIGGFAIGEQSASTSVCIARVSFKGENAFEIIVRELYDYDNVESIPVDNYVPEITPPSTSVPLPEYQPDHGYVFLGQVEVTHDQPSLPPPIESRQDVRETQSPELLDEEQLAKACGIVGISDPTSISASASDVSLSELNQTNTTVRQKAPVSIITPVFSIIIVLFIYYERTSLSIMRRR